MPLPKRRHHILPDQPGRNMMETLCNLVVEPQRDENDRILSFKTSPALHTIQCVFDPRDVSCSTCRFVWKRISFKAGEHHGQ